MNSNRRSKEAATGGSVLPHRAVRVLVCADDATAVESALDAAGYAVCTKSACDAAQRLIGADPPQFALVDTTSRVLDANRLASSLAAVHVPFVLISTADDRTLVQRAIDTGAMACFVKPLDVSVLVPAIAVWMARAADVKRLTDAERSLRNAIKTSRAVGTAVGILMERGGINAESAFETLRRQARRERLSMRCLADRTVDQRVADTDHRKPSEVGGKLLPA